MKIAVFLMLVILGGSEALAQRWGREWGLNYVYTAPTGSMGQIIERGHGGAFQYGFTTPDRRFSVGVDVNYTVYGHDKSRQMYTFDDGTTANMDVIVTNSFANAALYGNWYLRTEGKVLPYLTTSLGYSWYHTNLNIYDPDDWDHCAPVDTDVLYKDGTFFGSLGMGLKADFATVFNRLTPGSLYLDLRVQYSQGGEVKYMNTDAHLTHPMSSDGSHVMADFINTQTRVIHKHHVGYVYESPVRMIDLRVGIQLRVSKG